MKKKLIPKAQLGTILQNAVKYRFYNTIGSRWGYGDIKQAINSFITNTNKSEVQGDQDDEESDLQLATYLGIPVNKRHYQKELNKSQYVPSKGNQSNIYYKLDLDNRDKENLINESKGINYNFGGYNTNQINNDEGQLIYDGTPLNYGESKSSKILSSHNLGTHTISRGFDSKKGEYVSYYDQWDINPYKGYWGERNNNIITKALGLNKKDNINFLGTPVHFYDRIYLDDYYSVPEEYRGSQFLPEIKVTPENKSIFNI